LCNSPYGYNCKSAQGLPAVKRPNRDLSNQLPGIVLPGLITVNGENRMEGLVY